MLRWCLPTVRVSGGPGNPLLSFIRAKSTTYRVTVALNNSTNEGEAYFIPNRGTHVDAIAFRESAHSLGRPVDFNDGGAAAPSTTSHPLLPVHVGPSIAHHEVFPSMDEPESAVQAHTRQDTPLTTLDNVRIHAPEDRSTTPLFELKLVLAPTYSHRTPNHLSAQKLRSIYLSAKARSQSRELTPSEWSALLSVFGTLSLSSAQQPFRGLFAHPLVHSMSPSSKERTYWPFVVQLARDKTRFHKALSFSDRYWVMLAKIAESDLVEGENTAAGSDNRLDTVLSQARVHYISIGRALQHMDVHVPYLRALLRRPTSSRIHEATKALRSFVERNNRLHPRLWDVIWEPLLNPQLPTSLRDELVRSIVTFAERHDTVEPRYEMCADDISNKQHDSRLPLLSVDYACIKHLPKALDQALQQMSNHGVGADAAVSRWAIYVVRSLTDDRHIDAGITFKRLLLLSTATHRSSNDTLHQALSPTDGGILQSLQLMDWEATCLLAILERILHGDSKRIYATPATAVSESKQALQLAKMLWGLWSSFPTPQSHEPLVPSLIVASFLYIAGRSHDYDLVRECTSYLGPMLARNTGNPCHALAARHSTVEYALASLSCGYTLEVVLPVVVGHIADPRLLSLVVADIVARIAKVDPLLAKATADLARTMQVSVGAEVIMLLGTNLTAHGFVVEALRLTQDGILDSTQQHALLRSILRNWRSQYSVTSSPQHVLFLAQLIRSSFSLPLLKSVSTQLRDLLLTIVTYGDSALAVRLIRDIQTRESSYFPRSFLQAVSRYLVGRRHTHLAKLLARRYSHRFYSNKTPCSERDEVAGDLLPPKRRTMSVEHLEKIRKTKVVSAEVYTSMCNSYLHQHLFHKASRHTRRVARAMHALQRLVSKYEFSPDRVTINIIVKGLLLWTKEVDKDTVRALFDRMIQNGYPTGGLYPEGTTPFEGTNMKAPIALPKVESAISFARHAQPLYKMFITAMTARKDFEGVRVVARILTAAKAEYVRECIAREAEGRVNRRSG